MWQKIKANFTRSNWIAYADRVGTIGCFIPLLHFAVLPFAVFFYVIGEVGKSELVSNYFNDTVVITVTQQSIKSFYWLLAFWICATFMALVLFGLYRILTKLYAKGSFESAFVKTLLAVTFTSGAVERFVANSLMPMVVEGTKLQFSTADAPKFNISLYSDLGALVRSPVWELGHSIPSRYSYLVGTVFLALLVSYVGKRIKEEVGKATRHVEASRRSMGPEDQQ